MKTISIIPAALILLTIGLSTAQAADIKSEKENVNASCTQDATTAGCPSATVGKGLLKCLHTYKKDHKDFNFSEACKSTMKTLRTDKKK